MIIRLTTVMIIGTLFFIGCSNKKIAINYKNPKSVALAFTKGIMTMDIQTAKRAATEDTKAVLNLLEVLLESMPKEEKEQLVAKMQDNLNYLKKATCEVTGNQATCTTCCDQVGQPQEDLLLLKKVDKKWLVDMKKENLQ